MSSEQQPKMTVGAWVEAQGPDAVSICEANCTYSGGYEAWGAQTDDQAFNNLGSQPYIPEGNEGNCCDWCFLCKLAWAHFCYMNDM